MEKIITNKGGQRWFAVDRGEKATFSLIPVKMAIADVAEACEILYHLRAVELTEKRERFANWVFGKLRERYNNAWPGVWESYLASPDVEALLAEMEGIPEKKGPEEFAWLVDKALLVSRGAALSEDPYVIRELDDFLTSFADRQRARILATKEVKCN